MMTEFDPFIEDLRTSHGDNLVSVILYGSAAAGDFIPKQSDYNLLIALDKISPEDLRNAQPCMREWQKMGHPVPVYFTVSELQNASDVFPIEFHFMEIARKVLYGKDVLAGIKISDAFLRHQTEYELRSKLIRLRRAYIPASTSVERLVDLMADSLSNFASIFRAVLLLHGFTPPVTKHEIVALTVQELKIGGNSFETIFNIRENNFAKSLTDISANELFADYMQQIERVIASVNDIGKN
jgi:predicted nucleotidyltransferase